MKGLSRGRGKGLRLCRLLETSRLCRCSRGESGCQNPWIELQHRSEE